MDYNITGIQDSPGLQEVFNQITTIRGFFFSPQKLASWQKAAFQNKRPSYTPMLTDVHKIKVSCPFMKADIEKQKSLINTHES